MLQSQFKNVQFSFLLFFNLCSDVLSILRKKSVLSFFFFFHMQCSTMFKFLLFLFFSFRLFSIVLYVFVFVFIFFLLFFLSFFLFHNKLLIQCPLFFSTLYLPLCLYLNTITIGPLPSLFNFSLQYHKLSLIYNTTFSIAYEHSSFFFLFTKYPGCFFF